MSLNGVALSEQATTGSGRLGSDTSATSVNGQLYSSMLTTSDLGMMKCPPEMHVPGAA